MDFVEIVANSRIFSNMLQGQKKTGYGCNSLAKLLAINGYYIIIYIDFWSMICIGCIELYSYEFDSLPTFNQIRIYK